MVKRGLTSPRGYGARIRDRAYDETLYAYRGVGGGIFGALKYSYERLKHNVMIKTPLPNFPTAKI